MSIRLMTQVWESSEYDGKRLLIHLAMADFANDDGWFYARRETLARKARVSGEYVRQTIETMVEAGHLEVVAKGNSRGRATEYRLVTTATGLRSSDESNSPTRATPLATTATGLADESNTPYDQPSSTVSNNRPNDGAPPEAEPPAPPTVNQRANALARHFCDRRPMTNFPAVAGICRKAIVAGYADPAIAEALDRIIDENRSLSTEILRVELEGHGEYRDRKVSGTQRYLEASRDLSTGAAALEALAEPAPAIGAGS